MNGVIVLKWELYNFDVQHNCCDFNDTDLTATDIITRKREICHES